MWSSRFETRADREHFPRSGARLRGGHASPNGLPSSSPRTPMSDSDADPSYSVLPARLRRRIDRAFDNAIIEAGHSNPVSEPEPSRKRRKVEQSTTAPGGFIVDDLVPAAGGFIVDDEPAAGGFLPDDAGTRTSESSEDEDVPAHPTHTLPTH